MLESILIPESSPEPIPPILISESIPMSESILIPESVPEPIPIPLIMIPEPIPESIPETDFGPAIRNRFQKTSELAGIDSDEIFIFPITSF